MSPRPYLDITVDEYWSKVIGVYVGVAVGVVGGFVVRVGFCLGNVDVVHPTMTVMVSIVMLIIREIKFRFMLLLISGT